MEPEHTDETEDSIEERTGTELVEAWQQKNRAWNFEGESGTKNLEDLVKVLGYQGDGFRFGSVIETFLQDNPGAIHAIVEFICENAGENNEWKERLEEELGPEDGDDGEGE